MKKRSGVIIVDAENVSKELFQYAFSYIKHRKFCTSSDLYIFGNKQNIPLKYYNKYTQATLVNTYVGKNLADTYMCCFITKLLYENDDITTFFIITQDRDMSCAIKLISDYGKCAVSITDKDHPIRNIEKLGTDMLYVERWMFETTSDRKVPVNIKDIVVPYKDKDSLPSFYGTIFLKDKYVNKLYEVPFHNKTYIEDFECGIPGNILGRVKIRTMENTLKHNELKCIDGFVYLKEEGDYYE